MPTGYTAQIKEDTTFPEFAMICARAFGACISMRDDSGDAEIPEEFKPSDYHVEKVKEARANLHKAKEMSEEEQVAAAKEEWESKKEYHDKYVAERDAENARYSKMTGLVYGWDCPDTHAEFKAFMLQQLDISMDKDRWYAKDDGPLDGFKLWHEGHVEKLEKDILYHEKEYLEECSRVEGRNLWLNQLRGSL